jgi:hypothetical protein
MRISKTEIVYPRPKGASGAPVSNPGGIILKNLKAPESGKLVAANFLAVRLVRLNIQYGSVTDCLRLDH